MTAKVQHKSHSTASRPLSEHQPDPVSARPEIVQLFPVFTPPRAPASAEPTIESGSETHPIVVHFGKEKFNLLCPSDATVSDLKELIAQHTGVPVSFQKIACKGMLIRDGSRDSERLRDTGLHLDSRPQLMLLLNRAYHECEAASQALTRAASAVDSLQTDTKALQAAVARRQVGRAKTHVSLLQLNDRQQSLRALLRETEIIATEDKIVREIQRKQMRAKDIIKSKFTSIERELNELTKSNTI